MTVYHGTTNRRAQRICASGFLPRKPSRRVWFAKSRAYALQRARTQARRAHDRPVVLTCEIDVARLRQRLGPKRIFQGGGVIAISGPVPVDVLRTHPQVEVPTTPAELAAWVNHLLGVKHYKGVGRSHPGIDRLSRWVANRLRSVPKAKIRPAELLQMARQWLPEFFEDVEVDPARLRVHRKVKTIEVEIDAGQAEHGPREEEALGLLEDPKPVRRARGLAILAELEDPDLFDWCLMFLTDESTDVRVAALRTMLRCEQAEAEMVTPLAGSPDNRIRGAAIAALARHSGADAARWFERGLKDPSACVRVETAAVLAQLDPTENRKIFELALYDHNPQVARVARKLTEGKGYSKVAR